jgi:hypothetical protein
LNRATVALTLAIGAVAAAPAPVARAAQCGKPDLVDMVPPDKATGVALNATLAAHYAESAEHINENVVFIRPGGVEEMLAPTWNRTEHRLSVTPAYLASSTSYEVRWPALRGLNAAAPGVGGTANFTTGTTIDSAPPSFPGLAGVTWDLERETDDCVDELVERFVFDIDVGTATDDGGVGGLTLLLFQTRGPGITGLPVPLPPRAWPADGMRVQIRLAKADAVGEICFAGIARDPTGLISDSGAVEACVHTTDPPFFRGCSVSGPGPHSGVAAATLALIAVPLWFRRRTRR